MGGGGGSGRTSPRLAVVVLAMPAPVGFPVLNAEGLERGRLLDVLAGLRRVDGATVSVVTGDEETAREVGPELPPGVDVVAVGEGVPAGSVAAWAIRRRLGEAFERVVVLPGGALPLPARTVSTALSVLASADLVIGPTPVGGVYLVGARDEAGATVIAAGGGEVGAIEAAARATGLVWRRLEGRRDLGGVRSPDELRAALSGLDYGTPGLDRWLRARAAAGDGNGTAEDG